MIEAEKPKAKPKSAAELQKEKELAAEEERRQVRDVVVFELVVILNYFCIVLCIYFIFQAHLKQKAEEAKRAEEELKKAAKLKAEAKAQAFLK